MAPEAVARQERPARVDQAGRRLLSRQTARMSPSFFLMELAEREAHRERGARLGDTARSRGSALAL